MILFHVAAPVCTLLQQNSNLVSNGFSAFCQLLCQVIEPEERAVGACNVQSQLARSTDDNLGLRLASEVRAVSWDWALTLWDVTQSPDRLCQNGVKMWDTQLVSAESENFLVHVWKNPDIW